MSDNTILTPLGLRWEILKKDLAYSFRIWWEGLRGKIYNPFTLQGYRVSLIPTIKTALKGRVAGVGIAETAFWKSLERKKERFERGPDDNHGIPTYKCVCGKSAVVYQVGGPVYNGGITGSVAHFFHYYVPMCERCEGGIKPHDQNMDPVLYFYGLKGQGVRLFEGTECAAFLAAEMGTGREKQKHVKW